MNNKTGEQALSQQLQQLEAKITELETSNKTILKSLNDSERSGKEFDKKCSDMLSYLQSLTDQTVSSENELTSMRESLQCLDSKVEELFQLAGKFRNNVNHVKQTEHSSKGPSANSVHRHSRRDTKEEKRKKETKTSGVETTQDKQGDISKTQFSESSSSLVVRPKENIRVKTEQQVTERKAVTKNKLGLRGRSTQFDNDNRVFLLQKKHECGKDAKPQAAGTANSKDQATYNLPTRQEMSSKTTKMEAIPKTKRSPPRHRSTGTRNEYKNLAGLNRDPDVTPDIRELSSWKSMAEAERQRGLSMKHLKRGKGPDTCLLLDTSGSMEGENFQEMLELAKTYITGISQVAEVLGIEENIGIATFGENTRVAMHMTNEYDKLLEELDVLTPSGPSPMAAGLYMALACCLGHVSNTTIRDIAVGPKVILMTDGKGTPDIIASGEDDIPFSLEANLTKHLYLNEAIIDFERRKHRVYCVALKNTNPEDLENIYKKTHAKIYKGNEMSKLVRMTQNTIQAVNMIQMGLDFDDVDTSWMESLGLLGLKDLPLFQDSNWEEVTHLGKFLSSHGSKEKEIHKEFKESELPPVGVRVRRGPDWKWNDQDKGGPGTVIGHDDEVHVWVEWDCGHRNAYRAHQAFGYDILIVDEPRDLKGEMIAVGIPVQRGDNWRYGDDDGGPGNVGVVINVNKNGQIVVRWPNKNKGRYKFGYDGFFEVKICEPHMVFGNPGELKTHVWGTGSALGGSEESQENETTTSTDGSPETRTQGSEGEVKVQRIEDKSRATETEKREKVLSVDELNRRNNQMMQASSTDRSRDVDEEASSFSSLKRAHSKDVLWSFQIGQHWEDYPTEISTKLEKAYQRNKHGSSLFQFNEKLLKANFSTMKQECTKTKEITVIRRIEVDK